MLPLQSGTNIAKQENLFFSRVSVLFLRSEVPILKIIFSGELVAYKFCSTLQNATVHQYSWLPNTRYFLLFCFSCLVHIMFFLRNTKYNTSQYKYYAKNQ